MKMVDNATFKSEVLESSTPVVVDFFAEWCGPCRQMLPIFEELSKTATAKIVKVNIDDAPEIAGMFGVQSIPTFIVIKEGKEVDRKIGAMNKSKATEWINSIG